MFKDKTTLNELKRICNQLEVSEFEIVFRNKKYKVTPENILNSLVNILYSECYALKETYQTTGVFKKQNHFFDIDETFVSQLSTNNSSNDKIQEGWVIKKNLENGLVEVIKENRTKIVHYNQLANNALKDTVTIHFSKEDKYKQQTFYYVFSNQDFDLNKGITRIYWNINSDGAAILIKHITTKLNYYNIPFLFKCLNNPNLYFRRDAAVLYIEDENIQIIKHLLPDLCIAIQNYLEDDVPLFSFKYRKGVGIAENPNNHESFGMNRINILAESLLKFSNTKKDVDTMLKQISYDFIEKGINPEKPYLNKGSRILIN
jgi:hypothetical protein